MSWEYRVIEKNEDTLGRSYEIHEVYYDEDDKLQKWSTNPICPYGGNVDDLQGDLEFMMEATRLPTIKESELVVGNKRKSNDATVRFDDGEGKTNIDKDKF